jgi:hypothetical protein
MFIYYNFKEVAKIENEGKLHLISNSEVREFIFVAVLGYNM